MVNGDNRQALSAHVLVSQNGVQEAHHKKVFSWDCNWTIRLLGALLFIISLSLNLFQLGTPSIWFDEAFSVELARQPFPVLWNIVSRLEPNMELYYFFLYYWLQLLGFFGIAATEFMVRLPSALFAAISVVVVFVTVWHYFHRDVAFIGTLLYTLNYVFLIYAQQARSYALQLLLISLSLYALCRILFCKQRIPRHWLIFYVLCWSLAIYAHMFSLVILGIQCTTLLFLSTFPNNWRPQLRSCWKILLVAHMWICICIFPLFAAERTLTPKTGWLASPTADNLLHLLFMFAGYQYPYGLACILLIGSGCVPVLLSIFRVSLPAKKWITVPGKHVEENYQAYIPWIIFLASWLLVPIVLSYVISQGSIRIFSSRYLVVVILPLCLLLAWGIVALVRRWARVVLAILIIALALPAVPQYYRSAQVEDWNRASHWLLAHYEEGDGLLCYDNTITQGCQIATSYYLTTYSATARFSEDAPGAFSWSNFGPADPEHGYEEALDRNALLSYAQHHRRFFFIAGRVATGEAVARVQANMLWLSEIYDLQGKIETPTVTIWLFQTSP